MIPVRRWPGWNMLSRRSRPAVVELTCIGEKTMAASSVRLAFVLLMAIAVSAGAQRDMPRSGSGTGIIRGTPGYLESLAKDATTVVIGDVEIKTIELKRVALR
jgi:hypothetical protein